MSGLLKSPVLVFGSNGQLGTELQRTAQKSSLSLQALSRSDADIADAVAVSAAIEKFAPAVVVNAAAYTRVDDAEVEREKATQGNVTGPGVLAKTCEAYGAALIHVSSDYVFDGSKQGAYVETDPVAPIGFYGATKADGEAAVRAATASHVIIRVSWLYGEFGNNFLKTMLRLAGQRDEISVVADQHGCPTSTRDLAEAIVKVSDRIRSKDDVFGTYHFAGDGVTTWHGFASSAVGKFSALTGKQVRVKPITTAEYPTRTRRPANSALDCGKFERVFGFRGRPWRQEVEETAAALVKLQTNANV